MNGATAKRVALFVWGDSRPGGAERRFFRLFHYLRGQGQDIILYTSRAGLAGYRSLGLEPDLQNIRIFADLGDGFPRASRYLALIRRTLALVRGLRRDGVRQLHFGENPGPFSFLYSLLAGLACPFSVSLVDPVKDYQRNRRQKLFVALTARFSKYVDCLSPQIKDDLGVFLERRYENKFLVSPCSFTEPRPLQARRRRDIDVALIARMVPWKGHSLLRDALIALARTGDAPLQVHICGSGPLEVEITSNFAAVAGHEIHVHFESDPFELLMRSKVYVSLQDVENYPSQSLLEAMASGCAIIATDVGLTRLLLDESCAILIQRDAEQLATALRRLLRQDSLRAELGCSARAVVDSRHTIARFADYFIADVFHLYASGVSDAGK